MGKVHFFQLFDACLEHAQNDFNQRQLIEFRQSAERVFRGIEQNWPVAEEVLSSQEKEAIRKQMGVVQKALKKDDSQALKSELDSLGDLTRPLADSAMGRAVLAELQDRQVD